MSLNLKGKYDSNLFLQVLLNCFFPSREKVNEGKEERRRTGRLQSGRSVGWVGNGSAWTEALWDWLEEIFKCWLTDCLIDWLRWDVDWPVWDRGCRPDLSQLAVSQKKGWVGGWEGRRREAKLKKKWTKRNNEIKEDNPKINIYNRVKT